LKRITFYPNDPSIVRSVGWLGYGLTPWLALGILPAAIISDDTTAGAISGTAYSLIAASLAFPATRRYVVGAHRIFWDRFRCHLLSRRLSAKIRETLRNAGLTVTERRDVAGKDGRVSRREILHVPEVKIQTDGVNFYLRFRMLAGQTEQEWERKINAFAHVLQCSLVAFQIKRGVVDLTLQYGEIQAEAVTYKTDTDHTVTIGYAMGGMLTWYFDQFPHALVVGPTGTGKSTFVRNLLIQLQQEWTVKVADGKQVEFTHLQDLGFDVAADTVGFIRLVEEAQKEVDRRFKVMGRKRRNHYVDIGEEPYFLVVDEAIYLLEALSGKKETGESQRERILCLLRDISLRGRAAGVHLVMIFQRPDSTFIPTVIRDNLMVKIVLGGSETALEMAFGKEKSKALDPVSLGYGYSCIGDEKVELFRFPDYAQTTFLNDLWDQVQGETNDDQILYGCSIYKKPSRKSTNGTKSTIEQ
jgi:energy-coupling factor transporter ATP-binding protein EcfA2